MSKVQHYHLVSGLVIFTEAEGAPEERVHLNTTIITDDARVTATHIGQAQKALQMILFQKFGPMMVRDVFIMAISPLGQMTSEEFVAGMDELMAEAKASAQVAGNA